MAPLGMLAAGLFVLSVPGLSVWAAPVEDRLHSNDHSQVVLARSQQSMAGSIGKTTVSNACGYLSKVNYESFSDLDSDSDQEHLAERLATFFCDHQTAPTPGPVVAGPLGLAYSVTPTLPNSKRDETYTYTSTTSWVSPISTVTLGDPSSGTISPSIIVSSSALTTMTLTPTIPASTLVIPPTISTIPASVSIIPASTATVVSTIYNSTTIYPTTTTSTLTEPTTTTVFTVPSVSTFTSTTVIDGTSTVSMVFITTDSITMTQTVTPAPSPFTIAASWTSTVILPTVYTTTVEGSATIVIAPSVSYITPVGTPTASSSLTWPDFVAEAECIGSTKWDQCDDSDGDSDSDEEDLHKCRCERSGNALKKCFNANEQSGLRFAMQLMNDYMCGLAHKKPTYIPYTSSHYLTTKLQPVVTTKVETYMSTKTTVADVTAVMDVYGETIKVIGGAPGLHISLAGGAVALAAGIFGLML